ncbi:MAG TPA: hypothetical protein VEC18_03460, partial [Myxococcota bacterium]|nr:hypothetical protein [Myxococcota bacterium]
AERLLRRAAEARGRGWALSGIYASSCLVLLLAHWDRRRRSIDPALRARRRRRDAELRRIRAASGLPAAEAAAEIARALRALLAESSQPLPPEIDALIGECDARSYAPAAQRDRAALDPALAQRALELATRLCEREP